MNVNIEVLVNEVTNRMYSMESYYKSAAKHFPDNDSTWYERNYTAAWTFIWDVATILNTDTEKLYSIARSVRKWEEKHEWELCFPYKNHEEVIIKYLTEG